MGKSCLAWFPSVPPLCGPHSSGEAFLGLAPRRLGSQPSVQGTLFLTPGCFSSSWGTGNMRFLLWRLTEWKTPAFPGPWNNQLQLGFLRDTEEEHWSGAFLPRFALHQACQPGLNERLGERAHTGQCPGTVFLKAPGPAKYYTQQYWLNLGMRVSEL